MHRHRHPRDSSPAVYFQIFAGSALDLRRTLQKLLLDAVVIFLPAVVRKRRHIIKNKSVVLGVELLRRFRIPCAPSSAIAVNQLSKSSVVRGLLLRPGPNEGEQGADDRQRHIQDPTPSLGIIVDSSAHRCIHSVSPGNSGNESLQGDVPTREAYRIPFIVILQALKFRPIGIGEFGRYCPSPSHRSPVNRPFWPNP